jgi:hypothetical protein
MRSNKGLRKLDVDDFGQNLMILLTCTVFLLNGVGALALAF